MTRHEVQSLVASVPQDIKAQDRQMLTLLQVCWPCLRCQNQ